MNCAEKFHLIACIVVDNFLWSMLDGKWSRVCHRYEYYLPLRMKVGPGDRLLDLGCGVGGPMRNITRFTDANVVGMIRNKSK